MPRYLIYATHINVEFHVYDFINEQIFHKTNNLISISVMLLYQQKLLIMQNYLQTVI